MDSINEEILKIQSSYSNTEYDKKLLFFKRLRNYATCFRSKTFRCLTPGVADLKVADNSVSTSKYNLLTFLPKNLYIQLSKLAHIYFILIGACQLSKVLSTTGGNPTVFFDLGVIVVISMIKDFIEDRRRHAADKKENESTTLRFNPSNQNFEQVFRSQLRIGDIVKVLENESFPSDLVLLKSSLPNGSCFVETMNLDGEANLKHKSVPCPTLFEDETIKFSNLMNLELKYEQPNPQLYYFNGVLGEKKGDNQYAVGIKNLCLRSSSLKATEYIVGLVVYTGHQTKILLNSQKSRFKFSRIEVILNKMILWIFLLMVCLCVFCSTYSVIWFALKKKSLSYLDIKPSDFESQTFKSFFLMIQMWFVLLGQFVPISLMMTLEIVKFFQGMMLSIDKNYANTNDKQLVNVNSSSLCEELGLVKYVFSDKTGTLTMNQMIFKGLSLCGVSYEDSIETIQSDNILKSESLAELINSSILQDKLNQELEGLFCLNLCHTLMIERLNNQISYSGTSPDEESIMNFCKDVGFYFSNEDISQIVTLTVDLNKKIEYRFRKVAVLEFDFERKRMSVIVEDLQTQQYKLYSKGADSSIIDICQENQSDLIETTEGHLHQFSLKGLRTLAFGYRILEEKEVSEYLEKLQAIKKDLSKQEEHLHEVHKSIEKDLILLGGTGINDRLQENVKETIKNLKAASINVWMITGDKKETALNIARQCDLIQEDKELLILDQDKYDDNLQKTIDNYYDKSKKKEKYSILLTGHTLYAIDNHFSSTSSSSNKKEISVIQKLHWILFQSQSVVASKITPKQKAELVTIVRQLNPSIVTLAIGDGANDVSMITAAHVGIGIRGKEGRQAASISDFSIGEFRHLNRLILYQGQECYRKNTQMVFFNFYKNQVGFLVYLWYNFFSGQGGTYFYDEWIKQLYNLLFTSLPIVLFCLFDEIYPAHEFCTIRQTLPNKLEKMPKFYRHHLENPEFTILNFWKSFFKGSFHSIIITFLCIVSVAQSPHYNGRQTSHIDIGSLVFTIAVVIPNLSVLQIHKTHYPFTIFFIYGSIGICIFSLLIVSNIPTSESFGILHSLFEAPNAYFCILISLLVVCGFDKALGNWQHFSKHLKISKIPSVDQPTSKEETQVPFLAKSKPKQIKPPNPEYHVKIQMQPIS